MQIIVVLLLRAIEKLNISRLPSRGQTLSHSGLQSVILVQITIQERGLGVAICSLEGLADRFEEGFACDRRESVADLLQDAPARAAIELVIDRETLKGGIFWDCCQLYDSWRFRSCFKLTTKSESTLPAIMDEV